MDLVGRLEKTVELLITRVCALLFYSVWVLVISPPRVYQNDLVCNNKKMGLLIVSFCGGPYIILSYRFLNQTNIF